MLETYFVKPQTVDRIRACWIGAEIERYAAWLSEQGYSTRTVLRRVPALVAFGEFARLRGASVPADLPAHVDDFVAMRVASFRRGAEAATEIRGGIEQMLAVVLPGFERTGLRTLANRSPVPLSIGGTGSATRSAVAEAAAYRLVACTVHTAGQLDGGPVIRVTVDSDEAVLRVRIEADAIDDKQAAEIMARASDRIAAANGSATVETTGTAAARTTIMAVFPCAS
jgi:hypothetical protein